MDITLSKKDLQWIQQKYPRLSFNPQKNSLRGLLFFNREYNSTIIEDNYAIEIMLESKENSILPTVKEINQRIKHIAQDLSKSPLDLHLNVDDTLCLCIKPIEETYFPNGFDIKIFFEQVLEPYLYWVSFYEKFTFPPWDEYAHGKWGYLELYGENKISLNDIEPYFKLNELGVLKKLKGHHQCPCGNKKKLRTCHPLILQAIYKLKNNYD